MRSLDRLRQSYDEDAQVVVQDRKSPPRLLFSDTELLLEEVPIGTRVVFPNPPIEPLANWRPALFSRVCCQAHVYCCFSPLSGSGPL